MQGIKKFRRMPGILETASVVGYHEKHGPLGDLFDESDETDRFGKDTWEKSESEMQRRAVQRLLSKSFLTDRDVDVILAGDLINQCTGSSFGLLEYDVPYLGLYGACSTIVEGMLVASILYDGNFANRCVAVSSSHNAASERQFRSPLEYGGQRTPTAQWTVTGAGAILIGDGANVRVTEGLIGKAIDSGISDASNMGAAMAPATIDTLKRYFRESEKSPSDFDLIVTGDIGREGSSILEDLLLSEHIDVRKNHVDCGCMIYDAEKQDKHAGGSGCGCATVVFAADLFPNLRSGKLRDILLIGTGALLSPMSVQQGNAIPGIAHLLRIQHF